MKLKPIVHLFRRIRKLIEKRHQAYLEAMDIPVWTARCQPDEMIEASIPEMPATQQVAEPALAEATLPQATAAQGLKLGPGSGGVLLICARDSDSASKLANDIARVLPKNPVWAWPDGDESAIAPRDAVDENLFTSVAVFGDALAQLLFAKQVPAALGSATVVILPALSELAQDADARRLLWSELCRSGMAVS